MLQKYYIFSPIMTMSVMHDRRIIVNF